MNEYQEHHELPNNSSVKDAVQLLMDNPSLTPDVGKAIGLLWDLPKMKDLQILHKMHCAYFFDDIDRVSAEDYVPTRDDIIRVRIKTTGVQFYEVTDKERLWMFIDVSGQRSERRKWIHAFDGVRAVLYISALNGYDMMLDENDKINRMVDDLQLFEIVAAIQYLPSTWIFFQNKTDLFREKIKRVPISNYFPDIDKSKEQDFDYAVDFFRKKFQDVFKRGEITFHTTCAIDSKNLEKIYSSIIAHIIRQVVSGTGLMF